MHDAMEAGSDSEPDHARLHRQLRGSFATTYLTLLSIIQGVALADLAVVVGGGYEHLTAIQWLMVAMNFFTIVSVWNHFMPTLSRWSGYQASAMRSSRSPSAAWSSCSTTPW